MALGCRDGSTVYRFGTAIWQPTHYAGQASSSKAWIHVRNLMRMPRAPFKAGCMDVSSFSLVHSCAFKAPHEVVNLPLADTNPLRRTVANCSRMPAYETSSIR